MSSLIRVALRCQNLINYTECKRFAGHSKWANIKHIKAEKDGQKQAAINLLIRQMRAAISEGKTAKPEDNPKLARLVEQAKKNSIPIATIKNFLEKEQTSKTKVESVFVESRGPSGTIVLIHLLTSSVPRTRNVLNTHLKKVKFSQSELPMRSFFDEKGIVITEANNLDLDKAIEDAIEVGAEEAETFNDEDTEYFQFTCQPSQVMMVRKKLEEKNYKIINAEVEYIPKVTVKLNETELNMLQALYDRITPMEDVVKIYNNAEA